MKKSKSALAAVVALLIAPLGSESRPDLVNVEHWPQTRSVGLVDDETEAFVTELMSRMSLEEKVGQMIQADISAITPEDLRKYPLGSILIGGNTPPLNGDERAAAQVWLETTRAFHAVATEGRSGHTPIPLLFGVDAVHGNNNVKGATIFPHNSALGATRDPDLVRRIGIATARETAALGMDWAFAPTLAVPQDDRWGRTYEGYSEDPALVREYAAQMVLGLQGAPGAGRALQRGHVAATAKHFLGDGATTDGMDQGNAQVSEADLIRIHAQGYLSAIEAGAMTVMASYSSWHGQKMHGHKRLLTDVLKGRFGFQGFVIGDWNGHGQLPSCTKRSCAEAINAGVDMVMAPDSWKGMFENTLAQARSGAITQSRVDDAVRRILRVKAKLGLFDKDRPWEGRLEVLGSAEHRALAREAVRKSLVLLKNDGNVLPIKSTARVLVTGPGADDIGRQSGGWTLSWQGTGNTNADFPNGQSIFAGLREALEGGGGKVELSADGSFKQKPDVAIVVLGEEPSAEMRGDLRSLDYLAEHKEDLPLLKRLQAAGVPVVTVFLSGRPLWVNPLINASNAFVAAWLPGSEGGGVADVLIGDASGKSRHEFTGKLSYSWPKSATQTRLNIGAKPYAPLFAYGYGRTSRERFKIARLSENSGVKVVDTNIDKYFVGGRAVPPWNFVLRAGGQSTIAPVSGDPVNIGSLAMRSVDAGGIQEGGRQLSWNGQGEASVAVSGPAIDLLRQSNADMTLLISYRVDGAPSAPATLAMGCGAECTSVGALKFHPILSAARPNEWHVLKVSLNCFREAGANLASVTEPLVLTTAGTLQLSLGQVRIEPDPAGAQCPEAVNNKDGH